MKSISNILTRLFQILSVLVGWGLAESVLSTLLVYWNGARQYEFSWEYFNLSVDQNINLVQLASTIILVWLWTRQGIFLFVKKNEIDLYFRLESKYGSSCLICALDVFIERILCKSAFWRFCFDGKYSSNCNNHNILILTVFVNHCTLDQLCCTYKCKQVHQCTLAS